LSGLRPDFFISVFTVLALAVLALALLRGVSLVLVLALALDFLGGDCFDSLSQGVHLVRGEIFVGLFLYYYFVSCQMQQKIENELNKKEEDPP
jgi:uncharacterized BrkB/YihY/UPF0761 family membrane protein